MAVDDSMAKAVMGEKLVDVARRAKARCRENTLNIGLDRFFVCFMMDLLMENMLLESAEGDE